MEGEVDEGVAGVDCSGVDVDAGECGACDYEGSEFAEGGVGSVVEDLVWHRWRVWRVLGFRLVYFGAVLEGCRGGDSNRSINQ